MAAATRVYFAGYSLRRHSPAAASFRPPTKRSALSMDRSRDELSVNSRRFENTPEGVKSAAGRKVLEEDDEGERMCLKAYFEQAKVLMVSDGGGGPPRWFSPLECGSRLEKSPLLLYLPGIDGMGLGLILQHQKLGKIFDIWCLHIPVKDRTAFQELVVLVEEIVRSENHRCPDRPIYLVGESIGGSLALAVAARNPDIDLVLILTNPATCYNTSMVQSLSTLLEFIPSELSLISLPYLLSLTGEPLKKALSSVAKGPELQHLLEQLFQGLGNLSSYLSWKGSAPTEPERS